MGGFRTVKTNEILLGFSSSIGTSSSGSPKNKVSQMDSHHNMYGPIISNIEKRDTEKAEVER